jgi:AraC-like DNA-binding protein
MPRYAPDHAIDPDTAACPIVGMAIDTRQHASHWHNHRRTQLLYLSQGAVTVYTRDRVGQLAPMQALWLPSGLAHRTVMHGQFSYRSLYFDTGIYPSLPAEPVVLEVKPLLRELILCITEWSEDAELTRVQDRLVAVLLDELAAAPAALLSLPMPSDKRLLVIAQALLDKPDLTRSLDEWSTQAHASARTLARGFIRETGLTYRQWSTQCRLLAAQTLLAEGASVTEVAHRVGYASDSAFIAMYRRIYGKTPGRRIRESQLRANNEEDSLL